jgi:hypothetical protein
MSEYNRLVLAAAGWKKKARELTRALQRVLAAVDEGLNMEDVNLAVRSIENLHERDRRLTELLVVVDEVLARHPPTSMYWEDDNEFGRLRTAKHNVTPTKITYPTGHGTAPCRTCGSVLCKWAGKEAK